MEFLQGGRGIFKAGIVQHFAVEEEAVAHADGVAGQDVGAAVDVAVSLGHGVAGSGIRIQPVVEVGHNVLVLVQVHQDAFAAVLGSLGGADVHLEQDVRHGVRGAEQQVQLGGAVRLGHRDEFDVHVGQFFQLLPEPYGGPIGGHNVGVHVHGGHGDLFIRERELGHIQLGAFRGKSRDASHQHHECQQQRNESLFHGVTSFYF